MEIHENELLPGFQPQRHHAHRTAIEEFHAFHVGSADKPPFQRVRPAVIPAAYDILAPTPLRIRPCAFPAATTVQSPLSIPCKTRRRRAPARAEFRRSFLSIR